MSPRFTRRDFMSRLLPAPQDVSSEGQDSPPDARERHVLSRATFGGRPDELAEIKALGWKTWLEAQLHPSIIDDTEMESGLANLVATANTDLYAQSEFAYRCLYSKRQLAMRVVWFLNNHFNTELETTRAIAEQQENAAWLRGLANTSPLGEPLDTTFRELLYASAKSPAMIDYLDSASNIASAPNENYARELMELHTVGVFGGYTEDDVAEAAKIFTGWNRAYGFDQNGNANQASFLFNPFQHDSTPKTLAGIGFSTPGYSGSNGVREGEEFLDFLAAHPKTSELFVTKLCQYFLADIPPMDTVARVRAVFDASGGSLRPTIRAIFHDPAFFKSEKGKTMDSFEFVVNALRRLDVRTVDMSDAIDEIQALGVRVHNMPVPTGYPEVGAAWTGVGHVLPRWEFVDRFINQTGPRSLRFDWARLLPRTHEPASARGWVLWLLDLLVDRRVEARTIYELEAIAARVLNNLRTEPNPAAPEMRAMFTELAAVILSLPEAQLN